MSRRGVRAPLLLRPRRAARARRAAPLAARRVHGRGALHAALGALLPAAARPQRRRARGAADVPLPARGPVRLRRAAAPRAAEPRARPAGLPGARRPRPRCASRCSAPTTRPRCRAGCEARGGDLEAAHGHLPSTGRSRATSSRAHVNPYALLPDNGVWYVVGHDLDRDDDPHLPRLAHPRRHPLRDAARARLPAPGRVRRRGVPQPRRRGRSARSSARRASWSRPTPPGGSSARYGDRGNGSRTASSSPTTRRSALLASWVLRQDGRAVPLEPEELRRRGRRSRSSACARATRASRRSRRAERRARPADASPTGPRARSRRSASPCCRRCSPTCSPPAARTRRGDPGGRAGRALPHPARSQLEEHLSLLNLVNFGGGCYAVYAELRGDAVHVDKELYGDAFRSPPRLTPLEARAIRLALEFVGPMVAADAHTPLDRRAREARGDVRRVRARADAGAADRRAEEELVATLTQAIRERRLVEIEYLKEGEEQPSTRTRRAVLDRAPAAVLVRPHVGPHERRRALVPARPHAQREAADARRSSRARASSRALRGARRRADLVLAGVARWEVERGARAARRRRALARDSRSAAPSGSSARSCRTAARRSCSSRRAAARVAQRARELAAELRADARAELAADSRRALGERPGRVLGSISSSSSSSARARLVARSPTLPSATSAFRRSQPAVVARDEQPVVAAAQLVGVGLEPVDERDDAARRRRERRRRRGASRCRGSTGRRPGRCRSRRPGRRAPRGTAPGSRAGACVQ